MQLEKQDNINLNFINNYNYLITAKYASQEEVENFYLEIQDNLIPDQNKVNEEIVKIARDMDIGLVATNDVHYV
ncbi:MAG: hypothetical protein ABIA91_03550, partial [Patescibacteria group bacterium]